MRTILSSLIILLFVSAVWYNQGEPWKKEQHINAKELNILMQDNQKTKPIIYNIGFVNDIPDAIKIGSIKEAENLEKFENELGKVDKDAVIVIYCGCCPFKDCPNIRPAFQYLSEKGFNNHRLLDLPSNIKTDWIDKGYPLKVN